MELADLMLRGFEIRFAEFDWHFAAEFRGRQAPPKPDVQSFWSLKPCQKNQLIDNRL
jgi:hypothetical protein